MSLFGSEKPTKMSTTTIAYPFDPTGAAVTNRITGERQVLSPGDWKDFYTLVPLAAPFFGSSMVIIHHPSGRTLVDGVDYALTHRFHDASLATAKDIYGSITLYDKTLSGVLEFASYQTLGGEWTLNQVAIETLLAGHLRNPRTTTWEEVANPPHEFPVIDHEWNLDDMVGAKELEAKLQLIADAIANRQAGGLEDHKADFNNPHQVTKSQVGLGNVENFAVANTTEAEQGVLNNLYMTPLRTKQAIAIQVLQPLNVHKADFENPHHVTKEQVGLGSIANYGIATTAQAQQGTLNGAYMTPLRTSEAITALALAPLNAFIARRDNPHVVTAAQVGLGQVMNYPMADITIAQQGVSTTHYMSPAATRAMIVGTVGSDFTDHTNNLNNPHQVTAAQVGLGNVANYPVASQQQALDAVANNVYMTPLRTSQYVASAIDNAIDSHANDTNNPHLVTKDQVGLSNLENYPVAQQSQAEAGTSNTEYMTPLRTAQAIDARMSAGSGDLTNHIANTNNPHEVTAAQVGAYSTSQVDSALNLKLGKTEKAADSSRIDGKTYAELVAALSNSTVVTFNNAAAVGLSWTYIGTFPAMNAGNLLTNERIAFTVFADSSAKSLQSVAEVGLSFDPVYNTLVTNYLSLMGPENELIIGYSRVNNTSGDNIDVFVRGIGDRPKFTVQYHTRVPDFTKGPAGYLEVTEPVNWVPFTNRYNSTLHTLNPLGGAGRVLSTGVNGYESSNFIEELNVVAPADVTTAQTKVCGAGDLVAMMTTQVFQDAPYPVQSSISINNRWYYDAVSSKIKSFGTPLLGKLRGMYSRDEITSNTGIIEVEFDTSSASDQNGGLGLCLMQVEFNGRIYSIDVVRQPGGLGSSTMQGASFAKLLTVALNMGRVDTADLGSTSANMTWGDGVLDADRASMGTYVPAGHGWSQMGVIKLRAERTATQIKVFVSEPNGPLPGTPNVTVDLSTPMLAALFQSRPWRWGIISTTDVSDFNVKLNAYPGKYRSFINLGAAADASTASLYDYDGGQWNAKNMSGSTASPAVSRYRGRMVHSEIDGTIWFVTPSGQPRKLYVSAQSDQSRTVLTI